MPTSARHSIGKYQHSVEGHTFKPRHTAKSADRHCTLMIGVLNVSRCFVAIGLMLVLLTHGGCATSSLIKNTEKTAEDPDYERHEKILSAWHTKDDELLICCQGVSHVGKKPLTYSIRVQRIFLTWPRDGWHPNYPHKVKQWFPKFIPENKGLFDVDYVALNRKALSFQRSPELAHPPDAVPIPIVTPPEGWHLGRRMKFPLPEGQHEAIFIDPASVAEPVLVYVADKPIWNIKQNCTPFTMDRDIYHPNTTQWFALPIAVVSDVLTAPLQLLLFVSSGGKSYESGYGLRG